MLEVRCFATLSKHTPLDGKLEFFSGMTVRDLLRKLNIDEKDVKVVFVNGSYALLETKLKDGDRIGLFPAVGGG